MSPRSVGEDVLERVVRDQFRPAEPGRDLHVGVEIEFLCVERETLRPAHPIESPNSIGTTPATLPVVAALASRRGWRRTDGPGLPRFLRPDGTVISWEPGGQIEIATRPMSSLDAIDATVMDTAGELAGAFEAHGIGLLARGLDPWTPVDVPPLWLNHRRYRRMSAHYDRWGGSGRRMMRQSAALHVNLDLGGSPFERWHRSNLLVPAATAIFANSPIVEGRPGWRSERARAWRTLDPSRTGAFEPSSDPVGSYLRFARGAFAFLLGDDDEPAVPWADAGRGDEEAWREHLSTLFPEVRPRGYLEVRSIDALAPRHVTVAAAFLAGAVYGSADAPASPPPTKERLVRAGQRGLADAEMRTDALAWWDVALDGLTELGTGFASARLVERVEDFRATFTARGRDPGEVAEEWVSAQRGSTSVLP